jgi:hypothetical protein
LQFGSVHEEQEVSPPPLLEKPSPVEKANAETSLSVSAAPQASQRTSRFADMVRINFSNS